MNLTAAQTDVLAARVAQAEARTGVQIVTAVIGKSHTYPQLPWKAFALAVALAGLALVAVDALRPNWVTAGTALLQIGVLLAAGAAAALLVIFVPAFARLFLRKPRSDYEVRRCAESLFVRHQLFATRGRNGVLLLVSLFERKVEIIADRGFAGQVTPADWRRVIDPMTPLLQAGRAADALQAGIAAIEALLAGKGFAGRVGGTNELPDRPIDTTADDGADE
jgi:putative membrane protein